MELDRTYYTAIGTLRLFQSHKTKSVIPDR